MDTRVTSSRLLTRTAPRWVDRLYIALVIYAIACCVFMLSGVGGGGKRDNGGDEIGGRIGEKADIVGDVFAPDAA